MMKNVRETLARRVGILELYSLSKNEVEGLTFPNELGFSFPCLLARQPLVKKNNIIDVLGHIWRGGMPDVLFADPEQRQEYFNSYIETYLMRDVTEEGGITDTVRFRKFLNVCVALAAALRQQCVKRLAKTPKLYFCDTGLCAYLSMWLTRDTLMNGTASGHYFENFVIIELIKNYAYSSYKANLTGAKSKNMNFLTRQSRNMAMAVLFVCVKRFSD